MTPLDLAARGLAVFPCLASQAPATPRGLLDAVTTGRGARPAQTPPWPADRGGDGPGVRCRRPRRGPRRAGRRVAGRLLPPSAPDLHVADPIRRPASVVQARRGRAQLRLADRAGRWVSGYPAWGSDAPLSEVGDRSRRDAKQVLAPPGKGDRVSGRRLCRSVGRTSGTRHPGGAAVWRSVRRAGRWRGQVRAGPDDRRQDLEAGADAHGCLSADAKVSLQRLGYRVITPGD